MSGFKARRMIWDVVTTAEFSGLVLIPVSFFKLERSTALASLAVI
jgi:hypothetical protein